MELQLELELELELKLEDAALLVLGGHDNDNRLNGNNIKMTAAIKTVLFAFICIDVK